MDRQKCLFQSAILVLLFLFLYSNSEVCKVVYTGLPEDINDSTIQIPSQAVMMSENILVGIPGEISEDSIITYETPSIFFVIDHSRSMYQSGGKDQWGKRFDVTKKLLDTINVIYPNAEIGISVFAKNLYFDPSDDVGIIDSVEGYYSEYYSGGYLKLLKLDSTYSSDLFGSCSGYQLLCNYLQTDSSLYNKTYYTGLKYKPKNTNLAVSSTNITAGFDAVKSAFKKSENEKKSQYVIFISDGEAMYPSTATVKNAFKAGDSVPTTFTVYFTKDTIIPGQIDTMTQNIKGNKYSDNNKYSNAWSFDNNGSDTLMEFILSNIFSVINTKTVSEPNGIMVNGENPDTSIVNDSVTIYKFKNTFPFKSAKNDFHYEIVYKLYTDSINSDMDTVKTEKYDTTISDFTLELVENVPIPENFELLCWDRSIEFYHNGQQITYANETMDSVEVRFLPIELDMFYDYTDVSLFFETTNSAGIDEENIKLNQPSDYFSKNIAIPMSNVIKNDKKIQVSETDTIIAIFRNKDLPLDTLRAFLPFRLSNVITVESASYFDNDANGFVDSIFIETSGKDLTENSNDKDQILNNLEFPSHRNFEIIKSSIISSGIELTVKDNSAKENTSTKDEQISIKQFIMDNGGMFISGTVDVIDKMAPVIISASAIQYESDDNDDTLIVDYSESVGEIDFLQSSMFIRVDNNETYTVDHSSMGFKNDNATVLFKIESIEDDDVINNGDSIWINWKDNYVGDVNSDINFQRNEKNIRRPINATFIEMPFIIDSVAYFDNNADGHPDSLRFYIGNKNALSMDNDFDELVEKLNLPSFRDFKVKKKELYEDGFSLIVEEGNSECNTSTENDTVYIDNLELSNGSEIKLCVLFAIDKMAPVIVKAKAIQYEAENENDSLYINYSEKVSDINCKEPSLFYSPVTNNNYNVELELLTMMQTSDGAIFKINRISNAEIISVGDSIWIDWYGDYVSDRLDNPNYQLNSENIKREIEVLYHTLPIDIDLSVVSPIDFKKLDDKNKIPDFIINILNDDNLNDLEETDGDFHGMIIKTELKTEITNAVLLSGEFTLYDYLGNALVDKAEMSFSKDDNSLYFVWNGKNKNGRLVGSGTYLGFFKVYTGSVENNLERDEFSFRKFILVKD